MERTEGRDRGSGGEEQVRDQRGGVGGVEERSKGGNRGKGWREWRRGARE